MVGHDSRVMDKEGEMRLRIFMLLIRKDILFFPGWEPLAELVRNGVDKGEGGAGRGAGRPKT